MSAILGTSVTGAGGGAYTIDNSLRFRRSASAYLTKTPGSAGNRQKFTWSVWVKRGALADLTSYYIHSSGPNTSSDRSEFVFAGDYTLLVGFNVSGTWYEINTAAVFRDPSAWYHVVVAVDTTQATNTNRTKVYVNGVQQTMSGTYVPQNASTSVNNTVVQAIGYYSPSSAGYFDGCMAEYNFIDGQQLSPSDFGATNASTGVWQPKAYTGTYGTNGFYLKFSDIATTSGSNAGLGKDFSGNGNYYNTTNISVTSGVTYDAMTDSPTPKSSTVGNYCVGNPLFNPAHTTIAATWSQANSYLVDAGSATYNSDGVATFGVSSGKWYWEVTIGPNYSNGNNYSCPGISTSAVPDSLVYYGVIYKAYGSRIEGNAAGSATNIASAATVTVNDIVSIALDCDAQTIAFYKNNVLQQSVSYTSYLSPGNTTVYPGAFFANQTNAAGYFNFGQRPFTYTPPSGYVRLQTYNLPTPTIGASSTTLANKYFDALTWTGTGTTSSRTITGLNFQPDFVWAKSRSAAYVHCLYDAVRGAGANKELISNDTSAEGGGNQDQYGYLSSFNSDGFSSTVGSLGQNLYFNDTAYPAYAAWNWKANGSGSSNTAGSITSTVSANTTSGFSVVTYTGNEVSGATVGHGLGVAPKMIIVKDRSGAQNWAVYHASIGNTGGLALNLTNATITAAGWWNNTTPGSSVFTLGGGAQADRYNTNKNGDTYVAYCFAEVAGFSKFGSYTGNGSTDGPFVYCGFRPKFVMWKRTNTTGDGWWMLDSARNTYNVTNLVISAQSANAESTQTTPVDFLSNGFKIRNGADGSINASGSTYIFMAFAENPFNYSLAR